MYTLIFIFSHRKSDEKNYRHNGSKHSRKFYLLLIFSCMRWQMFNVNPKYSISTTFSNDLLAIFVLGFDPSQMIWIYTSAFSVFTCRPTSLLGAIKASVLLHYTHTFTQLLVTLCIDAVVPIPTTTHSLKTTNHVIMQLRCYGRYAVQRQQKDTQIIYSS